jgi:hypothetical protein
MTKEKIKAEMGRMATADELANAALSMYGSIKATERNQPRLVLAALPALERAIEKWAEINELEAVPESEGP